MVATRAQDLLEWEAQHQPTPEQPTKCGVTLTPLELEAGFCLDHVSPSCVALTLAISCHNL